MDALAEATEVYAALIENVGRHDPLKLSIAAMVYGLTAVGALVEAAGDDLVAYQGTPAPRHWPFRANAWSPTSPRYDMLAAAAMLLAEVKRMDDCASGQSASAPRGSGRGVQ